MQAKVLTAVYFLYNMTDEDLMDVYYEGDLEKFCNALTLDFADLETGRIKNKA